MFAILLSNSQVLPANFGQFKLFQISLPSLEGLILLTFIAFTRVTSPTSSITYFNPS